MQPLTPNDIIAAIAPLMRTTPTAIASPTRREPVRSARAICAFLMRRDIAAMTYREIAQAIGRRDHTTAINAVRRIEDLLQSNCLQTREIIEAFDLSNNGVGADPDQIAFSWMLTSFPQPHA